MISPPPTLDRELLDALEALGLIAADGSLDASWFTNPLSRITQMLSLPERRAALERMLDHLLPHDPAHPGARWHPVLSSNSGELCLTVAPSDDGRSSVWGAGARWTGATPGLPDISLSIEAPLVTLDDAGVHPVIASAAEPLRLALRIAIPGGAIGGVPIAAVSVALTIAGEARGLAVTLEKCDLGDGRGARDIAVDPAAITSDASDLLVALARAAVSECDAPPGPAREAIVAHLLPLIGLDAASTVPRLPLHEITAGVAALRGWFRAMATSGAPEWLTHLAGLFRGETVAVSGDGTTDRPWRVELIALSASSTLAFTLANDGTAMQLGLALDLAPGGTAPAAVMAVNATLLSIPFIATTPIAALPRYEILVRAPGDDNAWLAGGETTPFAVRSLRAGVRGAPSPQPVLELLEVRIDGNEHARLDLSTPDALADSAKTIVRDALLAAVGSSPTAQHLLALAGLATPAADPAWPHHLDLAAFVANPLQAIAAVHRGALLDSTHSWSALFGELTALAGVSGSITGTGTPADPWRAPLAADDSLGVDIIAWNAGSARLRIGLGANADHDPLFVSWRCELLAIDIPESGAADVRLIGEQEARFGIAPAPVPHSLPGTLIYADSLSAFVAWTPGQGMHGGGTLSGLEITVGTQTVSVPALTLPPVSALDPVHPETWLGVDAASLDVLLRALLTRASISWGGYSGFVVAALLGLHGSLAELPDGWPTLQPSGGADSILADPAAAFQDFLRRLVDPGAGTEPALPVALEWLAGVLGRSLPSRLVDPMVAAVGGRGAPDDPWLLPIADTGASVAAWLSPAGPPGAWASVLSQRLQDAEGIPDILDVAVELARIDARAADALAGIDTDQLGFAIARLAHELETGDGVVPYRSAVPNAPGWDRGSRLRYPHAGVPKDPDAIPQVLDRVDQLTPGMRAVLLVSPSFGDPADWSDLLAAAAARGHAVSSSATIDLRVPGIDPLQVSLDPLTTAADYYVVVLGAASDASPTEAQLGRVVDRVRSLRGGMPVILVGHSTAGLAARAFAAANVASTRGLITLATPLRGTPLLALRDIEVANALRRLSLLGPLGTTGGGLAATLAMLTAALDGWEKDAPNLPPRPSRFPWPEFAGGGTLETGGVSALAIGSGIDEDLVGALKAALSARIGELAAVPTATPTHLAFGLRAPIPLGDTHPGNVRVTADVTGELFRVILGGDRPRTEAGTRIAARVRLSKDGDWLAGSAGARDDPSTAPPETRVRDATFEVAFTPDDGVSVAVRLVDGAHRGVSASSVALGDALADPLLGAVGRSLDGAGPAAGALGDALLALGIGVRGADGAFGFSTDALVALRLAPGPFLSARLATALAAPGGWLGFTGPDGGPWVRPSTIASLSRVHDGSWNATLRVGADTPVPLADDAKLGIDATWGASAPVSFTLAAALGRATLSWSSTRGTLTFGGDDLCEPLTLWPAPDAAARRAWIASALPRFLLSAAASTFIEAAFGPGVRIGPIHALLHSPAKALARSEALGSTPGGLDADRVRGLIAAIANLLGPSGQPPQEGIALPGGLRVAVADGAGVRLTLATDAPIGGVVNLELAADVNASLEPTIGGRIGAHLDLSGAPWGSVDLAFAKDASGFSLVVTPASAPPITLLPFGGFGSLAAGLEALVPRVLQSLADAIGPTPLRSIALDIAAALGIYDSAGGFAAHADALRDLGTPGALDRVATAARSAVVGALLRFFTDASSPLTGALPGTFALDGETVRWTLGSLPGGTGSVAAAVGWETGGPRVVVSLDGLRLAGACTTNVSLSHASGATQLSASFDVDLLPTLGIAVAPRVDLAGGAGQALSLRFLPLGAGTESTLAVELAPSPGVTAGSGAGAGIASITASLAGAALLRRAAADLDRALWTGGPTARALLTAAGLVETSGTSSVVAHALPSVTTAIGGLLHALAAGAEVGIDANASLRFVEDGDVLGLRLSGSLERTVGAFLVKALFGPRDDALADPAAGITLDVLQRDSAGGTFSVAARLRAVGLGAEIARPGGDALFSSGSFRLGRAAGYVFFDLPLGDGPPPAEPFGAALALDAVSIPLGLADAGGDNPVAASLLQGSGGEAAAPGVDVLVARRAGATTFRIDGATQPFWIDVERAFGPLQIQRLGVQPLPGPGASLLVDGGVKVDGLDVQVDDLSVSFALADILHPEHWTLDLAGLALAYSRGGVSVAGGLRRDPGPPVEYDGLLLVRAAGRTVTAMGAYSRPSDAGGSFTSMFAFVALPWTLGGPPFFFVTGLAAGMGYNRALVIPAAVDDVPDHPLLRALDADALASDPMGALRSMRQLIPARRGGFWLAAGLRFTSFGLIQSRALVYVALDSGVEVGLLGVSRLVVPTADEAIASVELALKARISSVERILSVQAQLTDHSWLFSRDCQLTGGFALYWWFDTGDVVFTLGGYSKYFSPPPAYPVVPRLGFRWKASEHATASGTAYFAITTSCVMAGGSLSIDYLDGSVHAWFTTDADILVAWDPFHYDFDITIEVGASYTIEVCFIVCGTVTPSVTVGCGLRLHGPPLAGEVTVDLDVFSVTIPFGAAGEPPTYLTSWDAFADKYLFAGDPAREGVRALLAAGMERGDPTAPPPSGSAASPWLVGAEASFAIETRMPASTFGVQDQPPSPASGVDTLDIAPMREIAVTSALSVRVERQDGAGWTAVAFDPARLAITPVTGPVPEATWRFHPPKEMTAAANNLTALVGATFRVQASGRDPSAIVAVGTLATDDPAFARPLPLARARPADLDAWRAAGVAAEALAAVGSGSSAAKAIAVADAVLAGDARFAANREASGLNARGVPAGARRALARARSAPPCVAALSQGMTMRPPGLPGAPPIRPAVAAAPVPLDAPRLRAVLRPTPVGAAAAPHAPATTVRSRTVPRTLAPVPAPALVRTPTTTAPAVTRASTAGVAIASAETGTGTGKAHATAIAEAESAIRRGGVPIAGGVTQVWDLPAGAGRLHASGTAPIRVTSLGRGGDVLADVEIAAGAQAVPLELPAAAARIAITALGAPVAGADDHRISGWTSTQLAVRVASRTALVGGAHLVLPREPSSPEEGLAPIASLLAESPGLETALPATTRVVAVLLDEADCDAADAGDLAISIRGASAAAPRHITAGARRAVLYDVKPERGVARVSVAVASRRGFRLAGVLGLAGTAADGAAWLRARGLQLALPDAFASPGGEATVILEGGS